MNFSIFTFSLLALAAATVYTAPTSGTQELKAVFGNEKVTIAHQLSQGEFADVYWTSSKPPTIVKVNVKNEQEEEGYRKYRGWGPSEEFQILKKLDQLVSPIEGTVQTKHGERKAYHIKFVPGLKLGGLIKNGYIQTVEQMDALKHATIEAVQALHDVGIVHKDLTVNNILYDLRENQQLFDKNDVHVIDFGLSKDLKCQPRCRDNEYVKDFKIDFGQIDNLFVNQTGELIHLLQRKAEQQSALWSPRGSVTLDLPTQDSIPIGQLSSTSSVPDNWEDFAV